MKRYLIGTSLSGCIVDIMSGRVLEEEVLLIVTNTMHPFEDNPSHAFDNRRWEPEQSELIDRLWKQGRIHQPRKVSRWYENNVERQNYDADEEGYQENVFPRLDYPYMERWYTVAHFDCHDRIINPHKARKFGRTERKDMGLCLNGMVVKE